MENASSQFAPVATIFAKYNNFPSRVKLFSASKKSPLVSYDLNFGGDFNA